MRAKNPEMMIKLAVKGMLPDNNLSRKMISRLKVYAGESHPHSAQKVQQLDLK
jgi:large subunit ribosomal protein L13